MNLEYTIGRSRAGDRVNLSAYLYRLRGEPDIDEQMGALDIPASIEALKIAIKNLGNTKITTEFRYGVSSADIEAEIQSLNVALAEMLDTAIRIAYHLHGDELE